MYHYKEEYYAEKIKALTQAQPERPKGKWIRLFNGKSIGGAYWFACSKCERILPEVRTDEMLNWNFCPNCGADIRCEVEQ